MSATTGAAMARLLSISVGEISACTKRVVGNQRGPLPCASSQFRRAPISITTSGLFMPEADIPQPFCLR